ncbi:hypothetical protein LPJ54_006019, partial [Coemansia sp. RSA 1824]
MADITVDIKVVVNNGLPINMPPIVQCPSLTKLVIKVPINYNVVLGIVTLQPQLVELEIDRFKFDESLPDTDYKLIEPVSNIQR